MYMYIYIYIKILSQKRHVLWGIILNLKTHINFSQIFRLFSKPSTVCVDKALDEKFTYTAEIKS